MEYVILEVLTRVTMKLLSYTLTKEAQLDILLKQL
jgi:hypothetical protein